MGFSGIIIMCNILKFQREITFLSTVQKKWYKKLITSVPPKNP